MHSKKGTWQETLPDEMQLTATGNSNYKPVKHTRRFFFFCAAKQTQYIQKKARSRKKKTWQLFHQQPRMLARNDINSQHALPRSQHLVGAVLLLPYFLPSGRQMQHVQEWLTTTPTRTSLQTSERSMRELKALHHYLIPTTAIRIRRVGEKTTSELWETEERRQLTHLTKKHFFYELASIKLHSIQCYLHSALSKPQKPGCQF